VSPLSQTAQVFTTPPLIRTIFGTVQERFVPNKSVTLLLATVQNKVSYLHVNTCFLYTPFCYTTLQLVVYRNTKLQCVSKNVPSLTEYNFNTHPTIFTIFGTSSAVIQKSAAGITFSNTSLLLTL